MRLPSFRPRTVLGYLQQGRVVPGREFIRWLDQVERAINATTEVRTGTIRTTFEDKEPLGWKRLNGQTLSKSKYPGLYEIFGDEFGSTAATFNLPDATNRVLVGAGSIALAQYGGSAEVTLTPDNLPSHGHGVTDPGHSHNVTDPGHSHSITDPTHSHGITDPGHTHSAANANDTVNVANGGGKRSANSGTTGGSTTGITVDGAETGITVDSGETGVTVDSGTTGLTVNKTGGDQPFSILPLGVGVTVLVKT